MSDTLRCMCGQESVTERRMRYRERQMERRRKRERESSQQTTMKETKMEKEAGHLSFKYV